MPTPLPARCRSARPSGPAGDRRPPGRCGRDARAGPAARRLPPTTARDRHRRCGAGRDDRAGPRTTGRCRPIDLLAEPAKPDGTEAALDHATNIDIIEEKLRSFQIPAKVVATNTGPVVTQYEVKPEHHVKLSRIEALADDLAMALAARSIRIEAPIPGKSVVGIEIPNQAGEVVGFRALLDETEMLDATSPLTFALGRDVSGKAYAVDLAKMPHLLIAGATGSGKSVCVNAIITSILMRARPDEVRLDPHRPQARRARARSTGCRTSSST